MFKKLAPGVLSVQKCKRREVRVFLLAISGAISITSSFYVNGTTKTLEVRKNALQWSNATDKFTQPKPENEMG